MLGLIRSALNWLAARRRCPDCPHDKAIHGRYGCLGSDLTRSPAPACDCTRTETTRS